MGSHRRSSQKKEMRAPLKVAGFVACVVMVTTSCKGMGPVVRLTAKRLAAIAGQAVPVGGLVRQRPDPPAPSPRSDQVIETIKGLVRQLPDPPAPSPRSDQVIETIKKPLEELGKGIARDVGKKIAEEIDAMVGEAGRPKNPFSSSLVLDACSADATVSLEAFSPPTRRTIMSMYRTPGGHALDDADLAADLSRLHARGGTFSQAMMRIVVAHMRAKSDCKPSPIGGRTALALARWKRPARAMTEPTLTPGDNSQSTEIDDLAPTLQGFTGMSDPGVLTSRISPQSTGTDDLTPVLQGFAGSSHFGG